MNITSAQYAKDVRTDENISVTAVIDGQTWSVPLDLSNRHYMAIQEWVADGNEIQAAD